MVSYLHAVYMIAWLITSLLAEAIAYALGLTYSLKPGNLLVVVLAMIGGVWVATKIVKIMIWLTMMGSGYIIVSRILPLVLMKVGI